MFAKTFSPRPSLKLGEFHSVARIFVTYFFKKIYIFKLNKWLWAETKEKLESIRKWISTLLVFV